MMTRETDDGTSSLTVVSGLPGQRHYLEACRKDAEADRCALHRRYVVDPYWARCAAGGELESFASIRGLAPIADLDALEATGDPGIRGPLLIKEPAEIFRIAQAHQVMIVARAAALL